jgi:hypothetical protein
MKKKHMRFLRYFSKWPFPEDEPVTMYWLKSPVMSGRNKQWMMDIVFKRINGELIDFPVPWGCLPMLRYGKEFINQLPTGNDLGYTLNLSFSENAKYKIEEAYTAISPKNYQLVTKDNLQELCVIIFDTGKTVVIPCIEIIRFFFAVNKLLAYRIIQLYNFQDLVAATAEERTVQLDFTRRVSYRSIQRNPLVVKVLANILFDSFWAESWRGVYTSRTVNIFTNSDNPDRIIPLQCIPPVYQDCSWTVRAINDGKRVFVQEIYALNNNQAGTFDNIRFIHPGSRKRDKRSFINSTKTKGTNVEAKIDRDENKAPSNNNDPYLLQNELPIHKEKHVITIEEIPWVIGTNKTGLSGETEGVTLVKTGRLKRKITVSLNENGGQGEIHAAEFAALTDKSEIPNGLYSFFKAINAIKETHSNIKIDYSIGNVPESSVLAYCGVNSRQYGLIKLSLHDIASYIMELDLSDGHGLSTIIFKLKKEGLNLTSLVVDLLVDNITRQGFWAREKVERIDKIKVNWAKHTSIEPEAWGQRLIKKAIS